MNRRNYSLTVILIALLASFAVVVAQDKGNNTSADNALRGSGRVNPSTLGMEFQISLGSYPGRGINVPINLSYSSKVWRMQSTGMTKIPGSNDSRCYPLYAPTFAEFSASGWTTSLATPYIEYVGMKTYFNADGTPYSDGIECPSSTGPGPGSTFPSNARFFVRRLMVHLPSGETHELRPNDAVSYIGSNDNCLSSGNACSLAAWNMTYFATDGSNLKYVQDSVNGVFRLLMPDGSYYDFDSSATHGQDRKATQYTDRNGNYTTYHAPTATSPGYWTDTLGRTLVVPFDLKAPNAATSATEPQEYSMPGMTGKYKLHWKNLKASTATESALADFSQSLKYLGETYVCNNSLGMPTFCTRTSGAYLFNGGGDARITSETLFNPVLLKDIELPTGQKYKFGYDVYGRIEKIEYPTGGVEKFTYGLIPTLSKLESSDGVTEQANFGVTNRKVLRTATDTAPYEWVYSASYVSDAAGYKVSLTNPDGTRAERYLHRGYNSGSDLGKFGYDEALAGMAYEERGYDAASPAHLLSKKLTTWTKTQLTPTFSGSPGGVTGIAHWNARVTQVESIAYDTSGNGVSATSTYEYENESGLTTPGTPLLQKKTAEYAFVVAGDAIPSTPLRTTESTFLINDTSLTQTVRDGYANQNMVGLVTATVVNDSAGTIVSRSETLYDESTYGPAYRGNPTTSRLWDNIKGDSTSSGAYIITHAKFDTYGNRYQTIDALGNVTTTAYDTTYNAFPISSTSPVPDTTGTHGSTTGFTTYSTFDATTGLPLTTTDINGLNTRITYDWATLRPTAVRTYDGTSETANQVGAAKEVVYNDTVGNLWVKNREQIDADHWKEVITYFDALGRAFKTEQVNSRGNVFTEKEFDGDGRVLRVSNPYRTGETKKWTTNVYDDASRVIEVDLQDGSAVKTDYGVSVSGILGVTKTITDQAGKKRKGITDALGRMVRVVEDPAGLAWNTDYVFDTLGNLRKTTQGDQNRYFAHDSLGRLLFAKQVEQDANSAFSYTDPVTGNTQWSIKYEYDDAGNITRTTDARGFKVEGIYDGLNRLRNRNYPTVGDDTPDVEFWYDGTGLGLSSPLDKAKGKTTRVSNSVSETRYKGFNILGQLLSSEQRTPFSSSESVAAATPRTSSYVYDSYGRFKSQTYPSGRVVMADYDVDGAVASVSGRKDDVGRLYLNDIDYNAAGQMTSLRLGNGRWESTVYNDRLQVKQIGLGTLATDQSLLKLEYGYGDYTQNNGSLRSQTISFAGLPQSIVQTYSYDDLNRIQSAEEKIGGTTKWKQTFLIDRYGNRRFDENNTTTLVTNDATTNPTVDARNRFNSYTYDAAGSLTVDAENQRYVYDAENHQTKLFLPSNSSSTPDATYEYDGEGRRIRKKSWLEETVFVYDGMGVQIAEYTAFIAADPAPTAQISYLTTDHLGSPRVITNQNGQVISRKDYMAYGDEVSTANRTGLSGYGQVQETRRVYTGYDGDVESGLDFAQARYYGPKHGRFTSVDPLMASANVKDPQSLNRYSYVMNSPYKFTDPLGLLASTTGACGQGCTNSAGGSGGGYTDNYDSGRRSGLEGSIIEEYIRNEERRANDPIYQYFLRLGRAITAFNALVNSLGIESSASSSAQEESSSGAAGGGQPRSLFDLLWARHPGNLDDVDVHHQCAMTMSLAMMLLNWDFSDYKGSTQKIDFNGKTYKVALSAQQLWDYVVWHIERFNRYIRMLHPPIQNDSWTGDFRENSPTRINKDNQDFMIGKKGLVCTGSAGNGISSFSIR